MEHKAFRVFAMIFSVVGILGAVLFMFLSVQIKAGNETILRLLGDTAEDIGKYAMIMSFASGAMGAINLLSFILVTVGLVRQRLRRWYFLPGILGGFIAIGYVIGIIYFIIGLVAFFKADCIKYEGKEAHKHIIASLITFLVFGIAGSVLPFVLEFDPAYMSLVMFVGMCGLCIGSALITYFVCFPGSKAHILVKLFVAILMVGAMVGLYFLFRFLLKDNAARFDGDWPTIRNAVAIACSVGGFVHIAYLLFSIRNRSYNAYMGIVDVSIGIAIVGLIVTNFLVLYWWFVIEVILWIWSIFFFCLMISPFAMGGGGGGGLTPSYGEKRTIKDSSGKEIEVTYEGNLHYKGSDGSRWTETGEGTGKFTED